MCIFNTSAYADEYAYTLYRGILFNDDMTQRDGVSVVLPSKYFNKIIHKGSYHICYGNDDYAKTLTLGVIEDIIYSVAEPVSKHLDYLKSINATITGFSVVENDSVTRKPNVIDVSWTVGSENHYARFLKSSIAYCCGCYYDFMYKNNTDTSEIIRQLNESLVYDDFAQ